MGHSPGGQSRVREKKLAAQAFVLVLNVVKNWHIFGDVHPTRLAAACTFSDAGTTFRAFSGRALGRGQAEVSIPLSEALPALRSFIHSRPTPPSNPNAPLTTSQLEFS